MQGSRYWGQRGGAGWMSLFLVILVLLGETGLFVMARVGGRRNIPGFQNSTEIQGLARFAVEEHNKQQNTLLAFSRVVKAQEQVVAGTLYYLTIEAKDHGTPRLYEAKIWVKPWQNFKQLQEFKPVVQRAFTAADLGVKQEGLRGTGWRTVPVHDPVIQEAAELAVKNIQQKSNSLASYELQEVLVAKAEVIEDWVKFDLLLKIKRGTKDERYKVEMLRSNDGRWVFNHTQHYIAYQ